MPQCNDGRTRGKKSLLEDASNHELRAAGEVLLRGDSTLGPVWTDQLTDSSAADLRIVTDLFPGLPDTVKAASTSGSLTEATHPDPKQPKKERTELLALSHSVGMVVAACGCQPTVGQRNSG